MQNFLMPSLRKARSIAILAALTTALLPMTSVAAYPDKIVRIVVPFAPGGGTDIIARSLAEGMSRDLGQTVIVENKPGGGTIIGSDAVAKSAPDGYTLLMATFAHAVNPSFQPKLPYATDKAFAPIALIGVSPNVLVVRPENPYKTVKDVMDAARGAPGRLSYASQGSGTSAHLAGELFGNLAKAQLKHIPYRGAGPALNDLLGGHVDLMFGTAAAVHPHIKSGRLRALGVTTAKRSAALSNVPTLGESGLAGYAAESWYGVYGPAGMPADVTMRLNNAIKKAVSAESFQVRARNEGLDIAVGTPAELNAYVAGEELRWRKIVKENDIKPE